MQLYETISEQAHDMRVPLYAVTMAVAARADTPALLTLHWHGFGRETPLRLDDASPPPRSLPGSAIQVPLRWHAFEELDSMLLDAAWQLGAWDVERQGCAPWWRLGASAKEALAGHRAFGDYPDCPPDEQALIVDAPDQQDLLRMAAGKGYVRWQFRPRVGGIWAQLDDPDDTVDEGGARQPPCPVPPQPYDRHRPGRLVYRLGRVERLILPDSY
ncbi:diguanylate cyclase [Bordetella sp. 2513F-2]